MLAFLGVIAAKTAPIIDGVKSKGSNTVRLFGRFSFFIVPLYRATFATYRATFAPSHTIRLSYSARQNFLDTLIAHRLFAGLGIMLRFSTRFNPNIYNGSCYTKNYAIRYYQSPQSTRLQSFFNFGRCFFCNKRAHPSLYTNFLDEMPSALLKSFEERERIPNTGNMLQYTS